MLDGVAGLRYSALDGVAAFVTYFQLSPLLSLMLHLNPNGNGQDVYTSYQDSSGVGISKDIFDSKTLSFLAVYQ